MDSPVDLSEAEPLANYYGGLCRKFPVDYRGERYILKFRDPVWSRKSHASTAPYENTPVCEHLGCKVFELAGIPVQETFLATFRGEPVVACKDFLGPVGRRRALAEHYSIETSLRGNPPDAVLPELGRVLEVIETYPGLEGLRNEARRRFWQTFAVDALIGNTDRHAGNWGYLVDMASGGIVGLAPVYDCGSCLSPRISEAGMEHRIEDMGAHRTSIAWHPKPALMIGEGRPTYAEVMSDTRYAREAGEAFSWLRDTVSLEALASLVDETPTLSRLQRDFYTTTLALRMEEVIERGIELSRESRTHSVREER